MRRLIKVPFRNRYLLFVVAAAMLIALGLTMQLLLSDLPSVELLENHKARPASFIVDRNNKLLYEIIDPESGRQIDLTLGTIPPACIHATLATEDSRFFHHVGFDPIAIARAAIQNARAGGTVVSGGSTLTQQIVRILLLDEAERYEQTYVRKAREAFLAFRLEQRYTKEELLALYLNQSYYGNFAFGLESAAQTFFDKPASQLSTGECALLAGLVQYPGGYNPLVQPEFAKNRQLTVLRLMQESGYLTLEEADIVSEEPLRFRTNLFDISAPHFVMYVQDKLERVVSEEELRKGGLRIVTTIDKDLQTIAEQSVQRRLDMLNCRTGERCSPSSNPARRVDNASAVVLDSDSGEILAMVGSPDYFDERIQGNVNAALTLRQPGSAMKPLTYAVALDPGWSAKLGLDPLTPASIIADLPTTFYVRDDKGGNVPYQPVNYDRQYHGPVSVRSALANSYNIPAVKTLDRIGVESLRTISMQAGISSLTNEYGLALTLGGGEVSLLQLTAAFGVLDDGRRLDPISLLDVQRKEDGQWVSILRKNGEIVREERAHQVISPDTAFLITDILSDNAARVPAFGDNSVLHLPFDAAVKTGTTTDWRDNWTVGYSTEHIVGVWVGNADNKPMLDVSGIDGAGPIWREIMLQVHDSPPAPFVPTENIASMVICAPSGLLPTKHCTQRRMEHFIEGTQPTAPDAQFVTVMVDRRTGEPATESTPASQQVERIQWKLPPEYHDWAAAKGLSLIETSVIETEEPSRIGDSPGRVGIENQTDAQSVPDKKLILVEPASSTAYQLHPSLPKASQKTHVRGRAADGTKWAILRILKDGQMLAEATNASEIGLWWKLEAGSHHFVLEGVREIGSAAERSESAYVEITQFGNEVADLTTVDLQHTTDQPTVPLNQVNTTSDIMQ